MSISVNDLKIIASNGGGMILDARLFSANDIKIIASNASKSKASLIIKHPNTINLNDMKIIASNGKGCVVFDFYND